VKPLLLAVALLAAQLLHAAPETPRPISDAERAVVSAVAKALAEGPAALHEQLAADAPLRKLRDPDAIAEIATRTGPADGATWTLQATKLAEAVSFRVRFPSGLEDTLYFRMTKQGSRWAIAEIVSIAEPEKQEANTDRIRHAQLALLIAGLFLLLGTSIRPARAVLLLLAGIGGVVTLFLAVSHFAALPFVPLRALGPLREALARGDAAKIPAGTSAQARAVAERWMRPRPNQVADAETGSRDAATYYQRAMLAATSGSRSDAYKAFAIAWRLEPLARAEAVRNPVFFDLATEWLNDAREPLIYSKRAYAAPMTLPPNAKAWLSGESLRVEIGEARLEIPNGAELAPKGTPYVSPTAWHRVREQEALRDAERVLDDPKKATLARREDAAQVLARYNRWDDFLTLTADVENLSPLLIRDRVTALLRRDRLDEARAIATGPVVKKLIDDGSAPALLLTLGDAMVTAGSFDTAARLFRAVDDEEFATIRDARLRGVEARMKLAASSQTLPTDHFELRYDASVEYYTALELGRTIEAMYARIEAKLPPSNFRRVTVNVLNAQAFHRDVAGSDHIHGLYDGEILIPYVAGSGVTPELTSVIAHELTHAVVAAATTDNAPRWFQEGLAQHLEPGVMPGASGAALPVLVLDQLMSNAEKPQAMRSGYESARRFLLFLDTKYPAAIANLLRAFKKGQTSEQALSAVTGRSVDELSEEFQSWQYTPPATLQAETIQPAPVKQKIEIRWSRRPNP